jgi:hypothetical protein
VQLNLPPTLETIDGNDEPAGTTYHLDTYAAAAMLENALLNENFVLADEPARGYLLGMVAGKLCQ